jgi:hypothetical protein
MFKSRFVTEKWKICWVQNKISRIIQSTSMNCANLVRRSRFVSLSCSSHSLCRQQHPKGEWPVHLVYQPYFFKLRLPSNPTNRNLMKSARQKQTVTIHNKTRVHTNVFLTMTETTTPKLFSFRPESSSICVLCICMPVCACVCVLCMYVNINARSRTFNYTFKINLLWTLLKYMIDEDYFIKYLCYLIYYCGFHNPIKRM